MNKQSILVVLITSILFQNCGVSATKNDMESNISLPAEEYVCLPCGRSCDDTITGKPGFCNQCKMELVNKSSIVFKTILPKDLFAFILKTGADKIVLLDVRTEEEFNGTAPEKFGRLKNAINIPVQQLAGRINELEAYKEKEIIVYCSHSHRSPAASYLLSQKGFTKVTNLQHGMHRWLQEVTDKKINNSLYINQQ
jgi:rhodanese-related sulfurtransferase